MISRCYRLQFWLRHTQLDNTLVVADMMFWKPPLLSTGMMVPYFQEVRKLRFALAIRAKRCRVRTGLSTAHHSALHKLRGDSRVCVFGSGTSGGYARQGNIEFRVELRCMIGVGVRELLDRQVARTGQV